MTHDDFDRVDRLFAQALELPESERREFVNRVSTGDEALEQAILSLLDAERQGTFEVARDVAEMAWGELQKRVSRLRVGDLVGHYRLLDELGRGGMAVVHRARRIDGEFEHEVALKVAFPSPIGVGFDRRFAQERQILANLRHPNIAHLIDGGTSEQFGPFLVMELVEGTTIDQYCAQHQLDARARVELILQVLDGLSEAHRQLIVHRDLKPSNVLVRPDGFVKLLDFGIAKLLEPEADTPTGDSGVQTAHHVRVLTPQYASPEQVRMEPISTSTDVYQAGALLYALLVGESPHDIGSGTVAEIEQAVCDMEPVAPSVAAADHGQPAVPPKVLRGDLDAIVITALRKQPEQRYPSIGALAADLRCWLEQRPVSARRASRSYRLRRWLRGHRFQMIAAAVALAYAGSVTVLAQRWLEQRDVARAAVAREESVTEFLVQLFRDASPSVAGEGGLTALELMQRAPRRLDVMAPGAPQATEDVSLEARLRLTIATVLDELGDEDAAARELEHVVAISSHGSANALRAKLQQASHLARQRRSDEALTLLESLAPATRAADRNELESAQLEPYRMLLVARALNRDGRSAQGERTARGGLALLAAEREPTREQRALELLLRGCLADTVRRQGESDLAVELQRQVWTGYEALYGPDHPALIRQIGPFAAALGSRGSRNRSTDRTASDRDLIEVDQLLDRGLEIVRRHWGDQPLAAADLLDLKGMTAQVREDWETSANAFAAAQSIYDRHSSRAIAAGTSQMLAGVASMELGQPSRAEAQMTAALARFVDAGGERHSKVASAHYNLGRLAFRQRQWAQAATHYRSAVEIRAAKGTANPTLESWRLALADALGRWALATTGPASLERVGEALEIYGQSTAELSAAQNSLRDQLTDRRDTAN